MVYFKSLTSMIGRLTLQRIKTLIIKAVSVGRRKRCQRKVQKAQARRHGAVTEVSVWQEAEHREAAKSVKRKPSRQIKEPKVWKMMAATRI